MPGVEPGDVDLGLVERLCRMQLEAKRAEQRIRVENPSAELLELLELVGLREVLGLVGQPKREPEGGEQLGIEKVVEP